MAKEQTAKENHQERRRAGRAPAIVRVSYATVDAFFSDFTRNINEGGVFIETDEPQDLESRVHLRFELPGSNEPIKAAGRVVRVVPPEGDEPPGMAIEFDDLDDNARSRINDLVQQLRTRPS